MSTDVVTPRRAQRTKPRRGDRREEALLLAAERLLQANEYDEASIAQIAAAAEISRPTFYFYFASKDALLAHLIDRTMRSLAGSIAASIAAADTPQQKIAQAINATARIWQEHGPIMRAAVELSAALAEIDQLWTDTVHAVAETAAIAVIEASTTPETGDPDATRRLARALAWATERNLYNHFRTRADDQALDQLTQDLRTIWERTLGVAESPDD